MQKLSKAFKKDKVTVKPNGILDNLTLHWANEAARHKLLDVIGDLALIGTKIRGKVIATKPGHKINTHFARKMMKLIKPLTIWQNILTLKLRTVIVRWLMRKQLQFMPELIIRALIQGIFTALLKLLTLIWKPFLKKIG